VALSSARRSPRPAFRQELVTVTKLPSDFDIFSPAAALRKPLCIQTARRLAVMAQTLCAISFS